MPPTNMDFFERQEKARKKTRLLMVYFALAIACITAAIYLVCAAMFLHRHYQPGSLAWLWDPQVFLGAAGGTWLVIAGGTIYKLLELRRGGASVALGLGGVPLDGHTTDAEEQVLLNVVEEMAIASGTRIPAVYVLPEEPGINAFAAGNSPEDAAIGVTRGCMKHLNRDELQGVIAHEFSHILNGDMRLNLRLMGLINGILCLAIIGRVLLNVSSRRTSRLGARSRGRDPLPFIGLTLLVIGYIGVFFGRLIKSAVCREREYLADAAAVQFTRNPAGLAGALKKIGGSSAGSRIRSSVAEEASHLFFGNALRSSWLGLFSTHPPLVERIRALEPSFDGQFPHVSLQAGGPMPAGDGGAVETAAAESALGLTRPRARDLPAPAILAGAVMPQVGAPGNQHLRYAGALLASLPERLAAAAREPFGATALVYAILASTEEAVRAAQLTALNQTASPALSQETRALLAEAVRLPPSAKLALMDLALPALRGLSPAQYEQFKEAVRVLIEADRQIDLFEYTMRRIVLRHLEPHFQATRPAVIQYYALKPLTGECRVLLSALAHVGQDDAEARNRAFEIGAQMLRLDGDDRSLLPLEQADLAQVDAALDRLAASTPAIKRGVLAACVQTVAADGVIQEKEAELLRAIADALGCPIPPLLGLAQHVVLDPAA